jgi:hypothetical protein
MDTHKNAPLTPKDREAMVRAVGGQFRRRIIMGNNEGARLRLWREKRGEVRLSLVRLLFTGPRPIAASGDGRRGLLHFRR